MSKVHCDFEGNCKNKAYREVYPMALKGKKYEDSGWSYLCRKHFESEQKRFKKMGKILPYCGVDKPKRKVKKS